MHVPDEPCAQAEALFSPIQLLLPPLSVQVLQQVLVPPQPSEQL